MEYSNKENEWSENNNKQNKDVDLKWKFISKFSKDFLISSEKNLFLDEIMKKDSIASWSFLQKNIQKFKANNDEFKDFNENKLNIFDLKRAVWKEYLKLENYRTNYLENTFKNYDLNEKQREKLKKEIEGKSERELEKLINLDLEQNKFLDKIIWKNKYKKKNSFDILSNILDYEKIKLRIVSKSEDEKKEIHEILFWITQTWKVTDLDIKTLFSSGVFSHAEKKEFISIFIPFINLQEAVNYWLYTKDEADNHKKTLIKKELNKAILASDIEDEIIKSITLSDIKIDTQSFLSLESNLDILWQNIWFKNLEEDSKKNVEEIEENIVKNWVQSLKDLKSVLSWEKFSWKCENLEKFNELSIIKIFSKTKDWENIINYVEVVKINDETKEILYREVWNNYWGKEKINFKLTTTPNKVTFNNFIKKISESNFQKNIFYTKEDIKKQISDPENNLESSDLDLIDLSNLTVENRAKYEEDYKNNLNSELNDLLKELENNKNEILSIEKRIEKEKNTDFSSEKDNNKRKNLEKDSKKEILLLEEKLKALKLRNEKIQLFIDDKQNHINELQNWNVTTSELIPLINKNSLIKKLDELDPEWKSVWFEKWQFIKATDWKAKWWLYRIGWIDLVKQEVILESNWENGSQKEHLSFESFYNAFKENKAKRQENFNSFDKLINFSQSNSDSWKDISFSSNKIIQKWAWKEKKDLEVDFFVSKNQIIKVRNISWNQITISYWEKKESKDIEKAIEKNPKLAIKYKNHIYKDKDWKTKYGWISLEVGTQEYTYNLNQFNDILISGKDETLHFKPDATLWKWEKDLENDKSEQSEFEKKSKAWLIKWFFNNISLSEILMWGKMIVAWITEYFKKWNDIHAARVSLALWKILPEEVRADLLIKVERAEQEWMDKEIEWLWKVDSWIATDRIRWWLLDKNTPEYKKEAWLMFVLSKYGNLTWKNGLYEFKWKFVWYEAFGWKIWDELYMQIKAEAESSDPPQSFSEEQLMLMFLKRQCKPSWFNGIQRRSRLHKDFDGKWKTGIKEEVQKGYDDASNKRTAADMVKWWNEELMWWTLPNAIGWYKKAIERGSSLENMSEWFFLMLFSWALYTTDQAVYTTFIKSMWNNDWMPQIMARMSSNVPDMKLFNRTVVALSEKIEAKNPSKYWGMARKARWIYNRALNNEWTEKDRISDSKTFWKEYWEVLSRSLNMVSWSWNIAKDNEFIDTDKILIEELYKNPGIVSDNNEKESLVTLQNYYNKTQSYSEEWTFKKDFMEDAMWAEWISWLNILENVKLYFQLNQQWGARDEKAFNAVWKWILSDINRTKNKKVLVKILSQLIGWILVNTWFNETLLWIYNKPTTDLWKNFNKWGINIEKDFWSFSSTDVINIEKNVEPVLNRIANNIISWNSSWYSGPWIFDFTEKVKKKTDKAVNNSDYYSDYEQSA